MRASRRVLSRLAVAAMTAGIVLASAPRSSAQLPLEPIKDNGQSITAAYEGWYRDTDGSIKLLIGYFNRNRQQTIDIPIGPNNRIEPGGPDQGQPTHFLPRRHWGVFTITVPNDFGSKKLTWTIVANGQTTAIPMGLHADYQVEPFKDAAMGNTPPRLKFSEQGPELQGPPRGTALTLNASTASPLTLTAWVQDDGRVSSETARPPSGPPANLTWSLYRGPGTVTFDAAKPTVDVKDGRTASRATFSAPGEYVLRAQVNDASGDGGGGFQCCWTTAHVKVVVTPGAASR